MRTCFAQSSAFCEDEEAQPYLRWVLSTLAISVLHSSGEASRHTYAFPESMGATTYSLKCWCYCIPRGIAWHRFVRPTISHARQARFLSTLCIPSFRRALSDPLLRGSWMCVWFRHEVSSSSQFCGLCDKANKKCLSALFISLLNMSSSWKFPVRYHVAPIWATFSAGDDTSFSLSRPLPSSAVHPPPCRAILLASAASWLQAPGRRYSSRPTDTCRSVRFPRAEKKGRMLKLVLTTARAFVRTCTHSLALWNGIP